MLDFISKPCFSWFDYVFILVSIQLLSADTWPIAVIVFVGGIIISEAILPQWEVTSHV